MYSLGSHFWRRVGAASMALFLATLSVGFMPHVEPDPDERSLQLAREQDRSERSAEEYQEEDSFDYPEKFPTGQVPQTQELHLSPGDAEAHFQQGLLFHRDRKDDLALKYYRQATAINPKHQEARFYLGMLYLKKHRIPEAITELTKATQLDPADPGAHYYLGVAYLKRQNVTAALKEYEHLKSLGSNWAARLLAKIPQRNSTQHHLGE